MDQEVATPLRSRQQASRDEVLDAAAESFIERGFAATSIDDIADRLGCTKGRVYHYFRTKGELFLGVHHRALEMALAAVEPIASGEGAASQRLSEMAVAHAKLMMEESSYMRIAVQHAEMSLAMEGRTPRKAPDEVFEMRERYERLYEDVITEGIAAGEFRNSNASLMAKACLGSLNWMSVWFRPGTQGGRTRFKAADIPMEFAVFVTKGLVAGKDDAVPAAAKRKAR
jgi:AcrR family transcriptional regulator